MKQLLTNTNFAVKVIEKTIEYFLNDKLACKNYTDSLNTEQDDPIKLYFKFEMKIIYKAEEK